MSKKRNGPGEVKKITYEILKNRERWDGRKFTSVEVTEWYYGEYTPGRWFKISGAIEHMISSKKIIVEIAHDGFGDAIYLYTLLPARIRNKLMRDRKIP